MWIGSLANFNLGFLVPRPNSSAIESHEIVFSLGSFYQKISKKHFSEVFINLAYRSSTELKLDGARSPEMVSKAFFPIKDF